MAPGSKGESLPNILERVPKLVSQLLPLGLGDVAEGVLV